MSLEKLKRHNKSQINGAGPRYTPVLDKDAPNLEIQSLKDALDSIALTSDFRLRVEMLREELEGAVKKNSSIVQEIFKNKKLSPQHLISLMEKLEGATPADVKPLTIGIMRTLKVVRKGVNTHEDNLRSLDDRAEKIPNTSENKNSYELLQIRQFREVFSEIFNYFSYVIRDFSTNNKLLILGEWGTGKTHLLCDFVKNINLNQQACAFFLAQHLPIGVDPLQAISDSCAIARNIDSLLDCLNTAGEENGNRSLLVLDGINEGDRDEWKVAIKKLSKKVDRLNNVTLIISCRTPFQSIIFQDRLLKKFRHVYHSGFEEIELEAQEQFFKYYKIPFPEVPLLSDEFSRPLTLKLICKSLQNLSDKKKKRTFTGITSGQKGMTFVLESYIRALGKPIEKQFGLNDGVTWRLLKGTKKTKSKKEDGFAVRMATDQKEILSIDEAIDIILNVTGWTDKSNANRLLKSLVNAGVLFENYSWLNGGRQEIVKLPYQKFSDHIIARHLFDNYLDNKSIETVRRSFYANKPLGKIFRLTGGGRYYAKPNWAEALMIEFPERIKKLKPRVRELVFYLPQKRRYVEPSFEPIINSLLWRPPSSFCKGTEIVIKKLLSLDEKKNRMLDTLCALATKKHHPYNANRLNEFLINLTMVDRDLFWSEYLRNSFHGNTPNKLIMWAKSASEQKVTRATTKNALIILMWFLTCTSKPLRDRATESIIKLGFRHPDLVFDQALNSLEVNDPYVSERMLTASYGIAMNLWANNRRAKFKRQLIAFSKKLVTEMFLPDSEYATHNTLSRGSALGCINIARKIDKYSIANQYIKYLKPPFSHISSPFRDVGCITDQECDSVDRAIHMDFGNYTVGGLIPDRSSYQNEHNEYQRVLRQIKGRIYDLGYRTEDFEHIDRNIQSWRYEGNEKASKIDRYGKKYSWIAFYEMYGYREANDLLSEYEEGKRTSEVTIDPSLPQLPDRYSINLPNLFRSKFRSFAHWVEFGTKPDYENLLIQENMQSQKGPWVLLTGFIEQDGKNDDRRVFTFLRGLLVNQNRIDLLRKKYIEIPYPGNSAIPDIGDDYYTFAGEIPWSNYHAHFLRNKNGKVKRHIEEVFSSGEYVDDPEDFNDEDNADGPFSEFLNNRGKWINKPGIKVEIPAYRFSWEQYHSLVNQYSGYLLPSPAISSFLDLRYKSQSVELYDAHGKKATLFARNEEKRSNVKLLYIRKDLLDRYLKQTRQTMVWLNWGERGVHYDSFEKFRGQLSNYTKHEYIHKSFYEYSKV